MLGRDPRARPAGALHDDGASLAQAPWGLIDPGKGDVDRPRRVPGLPFAALPHVQQGRPLLNQGKILRGLDLEGLATVGRLAAEMTSKPVADSGREIGGG